jgi:protein involved in polysaccharide export with SLBB domain
MTAAPITGGTTVTGGAAVGRNTAMGLTAKASSRRVRVTGESGTAEIYDLYQFQRYGDLRENPYVKPGDRITILPAGRTVRITGEVFRPGTYELLPGEELESLVKDYADGFTLNADPGRIILSRISTEAAGETRIFDYGENTGMALEDKDVLTIGNKAVTRPVAFFEGALNSTAGGTGTIEETTSDIEGMAKLEYPFYEGETLGNAVRANARRFSVSSDLANAYVIRGGISIPMDLTRYIYYNDFGEDLELENGDIILIPFVQYFVLVSGAVKAPGRYPYVPDRQADYYINLAGGRDEMKNTGRGQTITDINHRKVKDDVVIEPEMMITVPMNSFMANFNVYAPIVTTFLSVITAFLSILAVSGVLGN